MNRDMRQIEWEACLLEPQPDRELEAFARREMGMVPQDLAYFTTCPWLARAAVIFNQRLTAHLDPRLADAIALVVSHENSCVQALTRTHDADILLTEAVRARLDPAFALTPRPATPIKGIAEPIVTFAVA